jgi:putative peptide zinc metalloprotease protein
MTDSPRATQPPAELAPDGPAQEVPGGSVPTLLPGVALDDLDTGANDQRYLLTLPDGRNFQLAAPLYHLASLLDGRRSHAETADALSDRIGRPVSASEVEAIITRKLAPLGILTTEAVPGFGPLAMGSLPAAPDAPLGILARLPLVPSRYLEPLADTVKHLYSPFLAVPMLLLIVIAHVFVYQQLGPHLAEFNPFTVPLVVLLLAPLMIQGVTPWHELGHAAAARYFGARHGPLGVGLMGITLVAYVEVTDIWRLPRRQRFFVDVGGVYFQSMSVILLALWAWATGDVAPLFVALAMDFAMLMNLNPLFKLDGYWAVSDATGIPNLHLRVGEQLGFVASTNILRLARLLRIRRLLDNQHLQRAATPSESMSGFGGGARLALALYSILFVLSAVYFVLMMIILMPMLLISYPMLALMAVTAIPAVMAGAIEPGVAAVILLQFFFVSMMLVAVIGAVVSLVLAALRRRRQPPGGFGGPNGLGGMGGFGGMGMDWRMRG